MRLAQHAAGAALPDALGEELAAFLGLPPELAGQALRDLDAG